MQHILEISNRDSSGHIQEVDLFASDPELSGDEGFMITLYDGLNDTESTVELTQEEMLQLMEVVNKEMNRRNNG